MKVKEEGALRLTGGEFHITHPLVHPSLFTISSLHPFNVLFCKTEGMFPA